MHENAALCGNEFTGPNFIFDRVENIVGKGENADYQHFLLFPRCFQKAFFSGSLKLVIMWRGVNFRSSGGFPA